VWQAKCTQKGLLRPSFVRPAEIRELRDYTRLRIDLTRVARSILVIVRYLLSDRAARYHDLGSDYYTSKTDKETGPSCAKRSAPRRLAAACFADRSGG
jgi:transposase